MLLDNTLNFFGRQLPAFTVLILIAVFISIIVLLWRTPSGKRAKVMDVMLAAVIGGVIAARALHVLLNWQYFADRTPDITRLERGGLSWVGAVTGALIGAFIVSRLRKLDFAQLLNQAAWVLPFIAMAAWAGCSLNFCLYGAEVTDMSEYPAFLTHEAPNVFGEIAPRFHTQLLGFALSVVLLVLAVYLQRTNTLPHRRFWLILGLFSGGMFGIGLLQA